MLHIRRDQNYENEMIQLHRHSEPL